MNIDKRALREVAEKATKGPWKVFSDIDTKTFSIHTPRDKRCENVIKWGGFDCQPNAEANAEFIAAFNPKVALALLDENIQLQREKDAIAVRTSAIPDGYGLVPQQIFLEPSDIELICSQCGDGHESGYGDFTDGLLWVGNIQRDDGSIVHGLHISSADYTEEGGVTVCEFAAQPRKGGAV
ncbi:ead/Ea22-like family protein [Salmonella enterica]|nr:ead/Ea22-like family protein [Salmonella enterica]